MSTPDDPRTLRSRSALITAAIDLVDERDVASLAITDVCQLAGVSRPTFYQHFGDLGTLVQAAALERLQQLFDESMAQEQRDEPAAMLDAGLKRLMHGLAAHALFYRRVLEGASALTAQSRVIDFVAARIMAFVERSGAADASRIAFRSRFLAAGATWLVIEHLGTDRLSPAELDRVASQIARQLASSILDEARS